jgi:ABC-2 type transport system permease protein
MNDFGIIFEAEFIRRIKSRAFLIGTILGAAMIVFLSAAPAIFSHGISGSTRAIVLAGDPAVTRAAKKLLADDFTISAQVPEVPRTAPSLADLKRDGDAAALVAFSNGAKGLDVTVYAKDAAGFRTTTLRDDIIPLKLALAVHASPTTIASLLDFTVDVHSLDAKFRDEASANAARGFAYVLVLLLYLAIILNCQGVLTSVAEEKTSRIAELLVATTSSSQLLAGKIAAAGTTGTIQLLVWLGVGWATAAGLVNSVGGASGGVHTKLSATTVGLGSIDIPTGVIVAFVIFFILGFLQYATLYAAAASLISRTEDLGSVAGPLTLPVLAGFLLANWALGVPNATGVAIASQIPLLTPFVMFTRMAVVTVPVWQVVLAIAINIIATIGIVWLTGKIYRVGLLMYGRLPKFTQIVNVLRTS